MEDGPKEDKRKSGDASWEAAVGLGRKPRLASVPKPTSPETALRGWPGWGSLSEEPAAVAALGGGAQPSLRAIVTVLAESLQQNRAGT